MTERIYYTDPYCRRFEASVTRAFTHEGRPAVALDRTAFYPSSGGQPFDVGRLGDSAVLEVVDLEDEIAHVVDTPLAEGGRVAGEIDWVRRFDHMQQHTGQHVLSAAFDRLFENPTTSFHMGAEVSTIDLQREVAAADVERAVDEANRVVWEDRPVTIRFATAEEAARLPLRKEPARQGSLRLIDVEGYDLSACGGTHVARTGSIGAIAVVGVERLRGGLRVTFVCGKRVVTALRGYRDAVTGSMRILSVLPAELPTAVERLQADAKDLRKTLKSMQEQLARFEAERLVSSAVETGDARVVVEVLDGWDANGLKSIAAAAAASSRTAIALVSSATPALVVVARSPDLTVDANAALKALIAQFGGRGGGKPDLAQGGGLAGDPADIARAARDMLQGR